MLIMIQLMWAGGGVWVWMDEWMELYCDNGILIV